MKNEKLKKVMLLNSNTAYINKTDIASIDPTQEVGFKTIPPLDAQRRQWTNAYEGQDFQTI